MFTAFVRLPDGTTQVLDSVEALLPFCQQEGCVFWADLGESPAEGLASLQAALALDPSAVEDCTTGDQRPRIDEFDDHLFVLFYGVTGAGDPPVLSPRKLSAFFGARYLVTAHIDPLPSVQAVLDRCRRNSQAMMHQGLDMLFFLVADGIADRHLLVATHLAARINVLEDVSLQPDVNESILAACSELRREVLELRGFAITQRELITPLCNGTYDYISDSLERRFGHVRDHLSQAVEMTERLREQLHAVRENYRAAIAHRTNEVMKTLTVADRKSVV